ncbi:MAG: alpha/beta hydrolase family esterase [Myxococcota bacterium]
MNARQINALVGSVAFSLGALAGCSGNGSEPGSESGGKTSAGGATGAGGNASISGGQTNASGGATQSFGGADAKGGSVAAGGSNAAGGSTSGGTSAGGSAQTSGGKAAGGSASTSGGSAAGGATSASGGSATGGSGGGTGGSTKSAGCGATDPPMSGKATIDVSGTQREYILKLPTNYDANTPYKLIFGWHPRGGTAETVASGGLGGGAYYGLEKRANGTAIFVSPNGIDNGWANTGGRDINFLKAMLAFFNSKLCIDQKRIFSTGFSYGGMMSDAIALDMPDVFRAIAPMSGALYSGGNRNSTLPIAVWMAHGDNDTVVPAADGEAALALFLKKNSCGAETVATTPSPCVAYQGCAAGYPVHYCKFSGGHTVPNFASEAIWQFFAQF